MRIASVKAPNGTSTGGSAGGSSGGRAGGRVGGRRRRRHLNSEPSSAGAGAGAGAGTGAGAGAGAASAVVVTCVVSKLKTEDITGLQTSIAAFVEDTTQLGLAYALKQVRFLSMWRRGKRAGVRGRVRTAVRGAEVVR